MSASNASNKVGDVLGDSVTLYRAFSDKSQRNRKKNKVRAGAFLLREDELEDGLSVGRTPKDAVKYLAVNYGYCSIPVYAVHELPYNLKVKADNTDPGHAFIINLPFITSSDRHREEAMLVGGELARKAKLESADRYIPNGGHSPIED